MRDLLRHLEAVHRKCEALDYSRSLIFCAACCERQSFAYKKSSSANASKMKISEDVLQEAWRGSINRTATFEVSDSDLAASDSTENFLYSIQTIQGINENNFAQSCREISEFGLNIVDALAYESLGLSVNGKNDALVDASALVRTEIERQNFSIEYLLRDRELQGLSEFRRNATKEDITLGHWFEQ